MGRPPRVNSASQNQLDEAAEQFDLFDQEVKSMTLDHMNKTPAKETEAQHGLSQNQIANSKDIYLKPEKSISGREKFNDKYKEDWEYSKQYVYFIAENIEVIGEAIEMWTKPYAGIPAEFWKIPTNKPVWGPRYLAEQLASRTYHRLKSQQSNIVSADGAGSYTGGMIVDETIHRLNARPATKQKSIFMGSSTF